MSVKKITKVDRANAAIDKAIERNLVLEAENTRLRKRIEVLEAEVRRKDARELEAIRFVRVVTDSVVLDDGGARLEHLCVRPEIPPTTALAAVLCSLRDAAKTSLMQKIAAGAQAQPNPTVQSLTRELSAIDAALTRLYRREPVSDTPDANHISSITFRRLCWVEHMLRNEKPEVSDSYARWQAKRSAHGLPPLGAHGLPPLGAQTQPRVLDLIERILDLCDKGSQT